MAPRAFLLAVTTAVHVLPAAAHASDAQLADLTLEQLGEVVVTTAARRAQPLAETAASVYVIDRDDIRRAGVRTLPEALRLAPNLLVARTDASNYAISARGFANILANRLLVMIDGRTVFSPLFSGVFWDAQDVMLEDVERIEVIDGPAETMWGTNAVHGVINVITRRAHATQGTLVSLGGGDQEAAAAVRHGAATAGGGAWRIFARGYGSEPSRFADGGDVGDRARRAHAGFRIDGESVRAAQWTLAGDVQVARVDQGEVTRKIGGGNLLARWRATVEPGTAWEVQAYYDRSEREHPGTFRATLDTLDIAAQATLRPAAAHTLLVGAGYRYQRDRVTNSPAQAFLPARRDLVTAYGVIQDEVALREDLALIVGLKAERNAYTHAEYLPTLRLRWHAPDGSTLWGAVSRAVRAPSRIDRDLHLPGAPPYAIAGNTTFTAETTDVFEAGARGRIGSRASWSLTAFRHEHDRLRSLEPRDGALRFANGIEGSTSGLEGWAHWQVTDRWRLAGGGLTLRQRLRVQPGVVDAGGLAALGNDPRYQWQLRSSHDIGNAVELDIIARRVGARPNPAVAAYTAVDARIGWRVTPALEVSLTLSSLGDDGHAEWGPAARPAEQRRAWFLRLLWQP